MVTDICPAQSLDHVWHTILQYDGTTEALLCAYKQNDTGNVSYKQILLWWYAQQLNNWKYTIKSLILTLLDNIRFNQEPPWSWNFMVIMRQPSKNLQVEQPYLFKIYPKSNHASL